MRKILVVDDEFTSRAILQKLLSAYGEVQVCTNGQDAVESFADALDRGEPFSLIFMDVMMPGMSGIEALDRIRRMEGVRGIGRGGGVRVVMTTGLDSSDSDLQDARSLFDTVIAKPIRLSAVTGALVSLGIS